MPEESTDLIETSVEPSTEVTEPGTPEPAGEVTAPATVEDPFAAYGGKDAIEAAHKMYQAAQSDDGVIQLFFEAGRSLGLGVKDIERLFAGTAPEPEEPEDLDRPATVKELQEALANQQKAQTTAAQERVQAAARTAVQTTVTELGLEPGTETTRLILEMGDKYLDKNDLNPTAVANAVRRGHADYQAFVEKEAKAYLAKKASKGASVPSAPSGSSAPASPPPVEPKNIQEAIKMARERLRSS